MNSHMQNDHKNLLLATTIAIALVVLFQIFAPSKPKSVLTEAKQDISAKSAALVVAQKLDVVAPLYQRQVLPIESKKLSGSLNLYGALFDDLKLIGYKETIAKDSSDVTLLSDQTSKSPYYIYWGWMGEEGRV